jgi:4-amino-4-deoxy-L-arabinose transferase-like glycosyltransferase
MVLVISLLTSAVLMAVVWVYNPDYLRDSSACRMSDAGAYLRLARNLIDHGRYSRCPAEPYLPEHLYPPVYPLVIGILDRIGGASAIYAVQALLRAGTCLLVYLIGKRIISERAGFWAGLFMSLDIYFLVYSLLILSETVFVFLLVAGVALGLSALHGRDSSPNAGKKLLRSAGAGVLLGLATLTRPQGLYLPLVLAIACVMVAWRGGYLRRAVVYATIMLATAYVVTGVWAVRDVVHFSKPFINSDIVLVYCASVSAHRHHAGISEEEARARIIEEFGLPPLEQMHNPHRFGRDLPGIVQDVNAISSAKWKLLSRYPLSLAQSCVRGSLKASVGHPLGAFAMMLGRPWVNPGTQDLIFSPSRAWARVFENTPPVWLLFVFHVAFAPCFLILAAAGIIGMFCNRPTRSAAVVLLILTGYFYLTLAMAGSGTDDRYRLPAFVFLCFFAGWTASRAVEVYRNWRSPAKPS